MRSVLSPSDLNKMKPVTPGWYPLEVISFKEEVTKGTTDKPSDGSMNAIFEFKAIDGPDNVKDRVFKRYFNEKALAFGNSLWATMFPGAYDKDKGGELTTAMFETMVGKKCQGYVKMDGKFPTIEDYRPMSA